MKFLVDNQLPAALARFLSSSGIYCQHVLDLDMGGASDAEIWNFAAAHEYVVISKSEDFLYLANRTSVAAGFLWIRLGNCRTDTLLAAVERVWPKIEAGLDAGDRVIEVR